MASDARLRLTIRWGRWRLAAPAAELLLDSSPQRRERLRELARDDPHLVRLPLGDLRQHLEDYRKSPQSAAKLVSVGEFPRNPQANVSELAAYTATAGMLLNLDEAITKE